jgi:hypothetical protein
MMLERQREGIRKAKAENRYLGRRPSARLKAAKLFREGRTLTDIADALSIGRGSVYPALEAADVKQQPAKSVAVALMSSRPSVPPVRAGLTPLDCEGFDSFGCTLHGGLAYGATAVAQALEYHRSVVNFGKALDPRSRADNEVEANRFNVCLLRITMKVFRGSCHQSGACDN